MPQSLHIWLLFTSLSYCSNNAERPNPHDNHDDVVDDDDDDGDDDVPVPNPVIETSITICINGKGCAGQQGRGAKGPCAMAEGGAALHSPAC